MNRSCAGSSGWPDASGYLLNHSAGLPPLDAQRALQETLFAPWTGDDDQVWVHWLNAIVDYREQLAAVMNTQSQFVCPQPSVSAALSQILGSLPRPPGRNRLLITERAFPSLGFVFSQLERRGLEVAMVPASANTLDIDSWVPYLDDRVHCVLFTHVHSNTSELHDIAPLGQLARDVGAVSIVDVAQSIGIREVDTKAWNVDFVIGSCIKWLCGGSGAGFLWVHPERLETCEPIDVGWFSHVDPFEFDIHHFAYAPDALRFWGGTPNVAPAVIAGHSIRALRNVGLEQIRERNRALTERLCAAAPVHALVSPRDVSQRGGSVILQMGADQEAFVASLRAAGLQFDLRSEGVRLSPHFYNGEDDIHKVIEAM